MMLEWPAYLCLEDRVTYGGATKRLGEMAVIGATIPESSESMRQNKVWLRDGLYGWWKATKSSCRLPAFRNSSHSRTKAHIPRFSPMADYLPEIGAIENLESQCRVVSSVERPSRTSWSSPCREISKAAQASSSFIEGKATSQGNRCGPRSRAGADRGLSPSAKSMALMAQTISDASSMGRFALPR